MLALLRLCLLTAFASLVSSKPTPPPTAPAVYNNCSGDYAVPLPNDTASTPFFKPQIRVNPLEIKENGTGWEEWLFLLHNRQPDGSELIYSYKWSLGDPASANVSHQMFAAWAHFPDGTFYHQVVHGVFEYEEYADGGFTYSIADNHLTWDPVKGIWHTSVNAGGWVIETDTVNVGPNIPFAPNYKSVPGQISDGFFSRIDVPRGHADGYMTFPWGATFPVVSVGTLKHTWSNKVMADTLSAYVRGSTFIPGDPLSPIATVNWYQAWGQSGKEIDSMQLLLQPDNSSIEEQVFRIQITDAPRVLSVVTEPKPASLPLSFNSTQFTLPMCGSGVDFKHTDRKMVWNVTNMYTIFKFLDSAGGVTLYQRVSVTGVVWNNGTAMEADGGVGVVEVYHR